MNARPSKTRRERIGELMSLIGLIIISCYLLNVLVGEPNKALRLTLLGGALVFSVLGQIIGTIRLWLIVALDTVLVVSIIVVYLI
jgi:hypothetical protein